MTSYAEMQDQRYLDLVAKTATSLRDAADRIMREAARPPGKYSNRVTQASGIVHEIHVTLMNLPLSNLIECAHEASPRAEEIQSPSTEERL